MNYNDEILKQAVENVKNSGKYTDDNYNVVTNNCQDAMDAVREEYRRLCYDSIQVLVSQPVDPNEIIGPSGYDTAQWVSVNQNLAYTVLFENDPEFATAPAQNVLVKAPIENDLNKYEPFSGLEILVLAVICSRFLKMLPPIPTGWMLGIH